MLFNFTAYNSLSSLEASGKVSSEIGDFRSDYAKTALYEHFKKCIFGLTSGKLMELGNLPTDLYETLPNKISQEEPSVGQAWLNSLNIQPSYLKKKTNSEQLADSPYILIQFSPPFSF